MNTALITLINLLDSDQLASTDVIKWGAPVPSFGDLLHSKVATLGLNPSNREFVDDVGNELRGKLRRFHTLQSLRIDSWSEIDARHLQLISESCRRYFEINPYDRWFKVLDFVVSGVDASYYSQKTTACHLDLIPYATAKKWNELSTQQRSKLLALTSNTLGLLLKDSPIKILILNGKSVVEIFQDVSGIRLEKQKVDAWTLPRRSSSHVVGLAYCGISETVSGLPLGRRLLILGFNHNLQSSYGVSLKVLQEIKNWVYGYVMENNL